MRALLEHAESIRAFEEHIDNDLDAPPEARTHLTQLLAIQDLAVLTEERDQIEAAHAIVHRRGLHPARLASAPAPQPR